MEAEKCISLILHDIERRKTVDFGDKQSVRQYNAAMDRIYMNGRRIDTSYPEYLGLLIELLYHKDIKVVLTIATMLQTLKNVSKAQRLEAIAVLEMHMAQNALTPVEKIACSININKWREEMPE